MFFDIRICTFFRCFLIFFVTFFLFKTSLFVQLWSVFRFSTQQEKFFHIEHQNNNKIKTEKWREFSSVSSEAISLKLSFFCFVWIYNKKETFFCLFFVLFANVNFILHTLKNDYWRTYNFCVQFKETVKTYCFCMIL